MTEITASTGVFAQKPDAAANALSTLMALFSGSVDGSLDGQAFGAYLTDSADGTSEGADGQPLSDLLAAFASEGTGTANPADRLAGFLSTLGAEVEAPDTFASQSFAPLFSLNANARAALEDSGSTLASKVGTLQNLASLGSLSADTVIKTAFPDLVPADKSGLKLGLTSGQSFEAGPPEGRPQTGPLNGLTVLQQALSETGRDPLEKPISILNETLAKLEGSFEASLTPQSAQPLGVQGQQTPAQTVAQGAEDAAIDDSLTPQIKDADASGLIAAEGQTQSGKRTDRDAAIAAATIKDGLADADRSEVRGSASQSGQTAAGSNAASSGASASGQGSGQGTGQQGGHNQGQQQPPSNSAAPGQQTDAREPNPAGQTKAVGTAVADLAQSLRPEPSAPLTPERVAGWSDARPFDAIAGGLSTLKTEATPFEPSLLANRNNPAVAQDAMRQMQVAVSRAVADGDTEFTVRLNPAELGRVTVKMQFAEAGGVRATVLVQSPETLEMLQRDARGLERALEAGGHKIDAGGIDLSLDTGDQESAGRQMAEALMEEKMKDALAAGMGDSADGDMTDGTDTDDPAATYLSDDAEDLTDSGLLDQILPHISPETGLDIRV